MFVPYLQSKQTCSIQSPQVNDFPHCVHLDKYSPYTILLFSFRFLADLDYSASKVFADQLSYMPTKNYRIFFIEKHCPPLLNWNALLESLYNEMSIINWHWSFLSGGRIASSRDCGLRAVPWYILGRIANPTERQTTPTSPTHSAAGSSLPLARRVRSGWIRFRIAGGR
jgi:hypothetical protein